MTLYWLFLVAAIATSMIGQTLLKSGAGADNFLAQLLHWHTVVGLGLYGGAAILYIVALRRIPLSVALPCTAISYVAAMLIGHFVYAEPISTMHIAAMVLISSGIVLLAFA